MTVLSFLKNIRFVNAFRRTLTASKYYNKKYSKIFKWAVESKEDTNFTYYLTDANMQYLAHTIAVVTDTDYQEVWSYFEEIQSDKAFQDSIVERMKNSPYKNFADAEVRLGRRLGWYAFVRICKPKVVIETGIDKGLGSITLCAALLRNKAEGHEGRYYGTDINPKAGFLLHGKYQEVGEILYGDSIESLKKFDKKIDLFINDSDHSEDYEYQEYLTIQNLINDESIILGDNAHCTDKLAIFAKETDRKFLYFQEETLNHWYPGAGIGIAYK